MTTGAGRSEIPTERGAGPLVRAWMLGAATRMIDAADELTELDARIGDGDHGINLARGMAAIREALLQDAEPDEPADLLRACGRRLISTVGGASGPLYGTLLLEAADGIEAGGGSVDALGAALARGVAGVARRGRSSVGQKTMLDTLVPAAEALREALGEGCEPEEATQRAAAAGAAGCESTREMVAQRGRASYLGERAVGHLDPGAVSSLLLVDALAAAAADQPPTSTPGGLSR